MVEILNIKKGATIIKINAAATNLNVVRIYTLNWLRFIVILSFHLCLGLPNGAFPSGFLNKILYAFLISLMFATVLIHIVLLDLVILIIFVKTTLPDTLT
jgi:hypothetical protein